MDAITTSFISSLLANAFTSMIAASGRESGNGLVPANDLRSLVQRPATDLAGKLIERDPDQQDRIARFLVSLEVEMLLRKLFMSKEAAADPGSISKIEQEFIALYGYIIDESATENDAPILFGLLLDACENSLQLAIEQGVLAAHEAMETLRYRQLQERLDAIEANIAFLCRGGLADATAVARFVADYLPQAGDRYGYIIPQSFDRQRKLPIDDLFVAPRFLLDQRLSSRGMGEPVPMPVAMTTIDRTVLLGNPGGGKTTFAHKLMHLLASGPDGRAIAGRPLVPFFVTLRDFAPAKARSGFSLPQFISSLINSDLQLRVPDGVVEYLLRTGRALVIFDGLDELIDTHRRREISADVESFATRFPDCPILVTSRAIGYDQAPLNERRFRVWQVAPFDETQAKEYVTKWFDTDEDLSPPERERLVKAFFVEVAHSRDLLQSPLMLALLCTLYRSAGSLPRNRPAVSRKCAELMFERWDRHRGIQVSLQYQSHLYFAIQQLAHWIYTGDDLGSGVTERQLIAKTTDYLADYCADDRAEAEAAAKDFVAFCRGRAWVFSEAGTDRDGEPLYAFTHRTFLEFFTASYLARNEGGPERLATFLVGQVSDGKWDVVAQLAFHIQDQAKAGSADVMIDKFLAAAKRAESKDTAFRLYGFLARCLRFLVPRPPVRRALVNDFMDFWLKQEHTPPTNNPLQPPSWPGDSVFLELLSSAQENRKTVIDTIREVTNSFLSGGAGDGSGLEAAAELALLTDKWNQTRSGGESGDGKIIVFDDDFLAQHASVFNALGNRDVRFACFLNTCDPVWSDLLILKKHGLGALLAAHWSSLLNIGLNTQEAFILRSLSFPEHNSDSLANPALIEVGDNLSQLPLPWITDCQEIDVGYGTPGFSKKNKKEFHTVDLDRGALFLGFVVGAVLVECACKSDVKPKRMNLEHFLVLIREATNFDEPIAHLVPMWRPRLSSNSADQEAIDWPALRFSEEQQRLARDWMAEKIEFVGDAAPSV